MRARRLRPSFETLIQRITPSDLAPLASPAVATPVDTSAPPCSTSVIITDLGPWMVTGDPQPPPCNVLQPVVDPLDWGCSS
jgi:hypothetical protein